MIFVRLKGFKTLCTGGEDVVEITYRARLVGTRDNSFQ
jgi:hypothetical protein